MEDVFFEVPGNFNDSLLFHFEVVIRDDSPWENDHCKYDAFVAKVIDQNILMGDRFYKWLYEKHSYIAALMWIQPYSCEKWHTDDYRSSTVNMLLSLGHSHCCFGFNHNES